MISKMTKYDFVLYAGQSEDFIERLRELGLVDITTTGWEPQEDDRQLITDIESRLKAKDSLEAFRAGESFVAEAEKTTNVFEKYTATMQQIAEEISPLRSRRFSSGWRERSPQGVYWLIRLNRKLPLGSRSVSVSMTPLVLVGLLGRIKWRTRRPR